MTLRTTFDPDRCQQRNRCLSKFPWSAPAHFGAEVAKHFQPGDIALHFNGRRSNALS